MLVPMLRLTLQTVLDEHAQTGGGCDDACCLCNAGGAVNGGLWAAEVLNAQLGTWLDDGPRNKQRRLAQELEAEIDAVLAEQQVEAPHEVCPCQRHGATEGAALTAAEQLSEALERLATEQQWTAHPDGTSSGDDDIRADCISLAWMARLIGRETKAIADVTQPDRRERVAVLARVEVRQVVADKPKCWDGLALPWRANSDNEEQSLWSLDVAAEALARVAEDYADKDAEQGDSAEVVEKANGFAFLCRTASEELGLLFASPGPRRRAEYDQKFLEDVAEYQAKRAQAEREQDAEVEPVCVGG